MRDSLADPVVRAAATQLVEEGLAIAAAMGQPGAGGSAERIEQAAGDQPTSPPSCRTSRLGRPMEVDALFQVPLRLARESGVPAPMLALTVALMAQAAEAAGLYKPAAGRGRGRCSRPSSTISSSMSATGWRRGPRALAALGFQLTPMGKHSLGSANHLAVFGEDYLELLGTDHAGRGAAAGHRQPIRSG